MKLKQRIFEYCLNKNKDESWDILSKKFGYSSKDAIRSAFRREKIKRKIQEIYDEDRKEELEEEGAYAYNQYGESIEYHKDGSITSDKLIEICNAQEKTPEFLLNAHGFDSNKWNLVYARNNLWHGLQKGGVDRTILYQSKITVAPKKQLEWSTELVDRLFESLKIKNLSPIKIKPNFYFPNNKVLVVPIADLHLGLLATQASTGNEYNIEIAELSFNNAIAQIKERVANQRFQEIVFVVGNDFLNFDNLSGTTTAGTAQDNDSFWFEMFDKAIELIISGTLSLLEISKVKIINVVSNHDHQSMYGVMKAIQYYFKDNKDVTVDISQLPRKYYRFDKVLLGFSHDIVIKNALSLMTTESKENWSFCNKYYWFLAHLHRAMQYDNQGSLEIIRWPTISGFSRWSASKGYVQNDQRTQVFIIDGELGILDALNIFV